MIRIRNLSDGSTLDLGYAYSVELLDRDQNPALILIPDIGQQSVKLVTALEDAKTAQTYAATFGLTLSTILKPDLSTLAKP